MPAVLTGAEMSQIFITLGGGPDVLVDNHPASVKLSEIFNQTATAANHIQLHQFQVILMLPQAAEDTRNIVLGSYLDRGQGAFTDTRSSVPEHLVDDRFVSGRTVEPQQVLPNRQYTLMRPVFLGEALLFLGAAIIDMPSISSRSATSGLEKSTVVILCDCGYVGRSLRPAVL